MSEAFGIMDPAYFVNKNELLKWINTLLKLNVEKIDSLGSGSVYCQLLDIIFPGSVPMGKVNWKAKLEYEYLSNFKIVTSCLEKNDVKKNVDVGKLAKCKYQDNLEFAQWFKRFFDMKCGERTSDYDPEARRGVKLSTAADVPKVARKEQQMAAKNAQVNQAESQIKTPSTIAPTTTPASNHAVTSSTAATTASTTAAKKQVTPVKPAIVNAKRPLSQVYGTTPSTLAAGKNAITKPAAVTKPVVKPAVVVNQSKDFTLLVNSIKDILHSSSSESEMLNKIRVLVKDNEKPSVVAAVASSAVVQEEKENVNLEQVQESQVNKETNGNGSAIEQETQ